MVPLHIVIIVLLMDELLLHLIDDYYWSCYVIHYPNHSSMVVHYNNMFSLIRISHDSDEEHKCREVMVPVEHSLRYVYISDHPIVTMKGKRKANRWR